MASWRLRPVIPSTASSCTISSARRGWPNESNAPALISDSMMRLLQQSRSTFSRKSVKEVNRPLSRRVLMIDSTTFAPTLRTAPSPKRMSPSTARNHRSESLTSGGSTLMPMRRHSAR